MKIGSLFSGIGGLELGITSALVGSSVEWSVENNSACKKVLANRFPSSLHHHDVKDFGKGGTGSLPAVDLICGGFP